MTNPNDLVHDTEFRGAGAVQNDLQRGYTCGGLTKREYFAGLAMQGVCSANNSVSTTVYESVRLADALILELNKEVK